MKSKIYFKTLFLYVSTEYLLGFLICFTLVFSLFFINQLLVEVQELLSLKVSAISTIKLIVLASPVFIAFSFPYAALLGSLLSTGRLSKYNEVVALKSLGISMHIFFIPFLFWSFTIFLGAFYTHNYLMPIGLDLFRKTYYEVTQDNPKIVFQPYTMKNVGKRLMIIPSVDSVGANGILILDNSENGEPRILSARKSKLLKKAEQGYISLELKDTLIINAKNSQDYSYIHADKAIYNVLFSVINSNISRVDDIEKSVFEIRSEIEKIKTEEKAAENTFYLNQSLNRLKYKDYIEKQKSGLAIDENEIETTLESAKTKYDYDPRNLNSYIYSFWEKIYQPTMCIIFTIFGFSLSVFSNRNGRVINFGIGGVLSVIYYFFETGLKSFSADIYSYTIANFLPALPNLVFLALALIFYSRIKS